MEEKQSVSGINLLVCFSLKTIVFLENVCDNRSRFNVTANIFNLPSVGYIAVTDLKSRGKTLSCAVLLKVVWVVYHLKAPDSDKVAITLRALRLRAITQHL